MREAESNSARNAVVKRRPSWLLQQAYRFMPATRSFNEHGVIESVFRLAWKVAISRAAGILLPATSATAIKKCSSLFALLAGRAGFEVATIEAETGSRVLLELKPELI